MKISGPFNLLSPSDVARLKVQIREQRARGVHVETHKANRYKIGVDLYRAADGIQTALAVRRGEIRSTPGNDAVNQNGGRHR